MYVDLFRMTLNSSSRAHEFHYRRTHIQSLWFDLRRNRFDRASFRQKPTKMNRNRNSNALEWYHVQTTNMWVMAAQQVSCRIDCFSLFGGDFNLIYTGKKWHKIIEYDWNHNIVRVHVIDGAIWCDGVYATDRRHKQPSQNTVMWYH